MLCGPQGSTDTQRQVPHPRTRGWKDRRAPTVRSRGSPVSRVAPESRAPRSVTLSLWAAPKSPPQGPRGRSASRQLPGQNGRPNTHTLSRSRPPFCPVWQGQCPARPGLFWGYGRGGVLTPVSCSGWFHRPRRAREHAKTVPPEGNPGTGPGDSPEGQGPEPDRSRGLPGGERGAESWAGCRQPLEGLVGKTGLWTWNARQAPSKVLHIMLKRRSGLADVWAKGRGLCWG